MEDDCNPSGIERVCIIGSRVSGEDEMAMKRSINWSVVTGLVTIGVLAATNPSTDFYAEYLTSEAVTQSPNILCSQLNSFRSLDSAPLVDPLISLCKGLSNFGVAFLLKDDIKQFVKQQTVRQNYIVCSLYTTRIPGRTIRTIGILNNFLPYSSY